jgi:hypothetical protein
MRFGKLLEGVTIPPNWAKAYGYYGPRRVIIAWHDDTDDRGAMVDDGRAHAPMWNNDILDDLLSLLENAGHIGVSDAVVGVTDPATGRYHIVQPATHALILNLNDRTIRLAPIIEALGWIRSSTPCIPIPDVFLPEHLRMIDLSDEAAVAEILDPNQMTCPICGGYGWIRAKDYPICGYIQCENCEGTGDLPRKS